MKFKNIYKETKEDVELSLLSLWTPGTHRMRPAMQELFRREPLMAEPVFQSMFPWELDSGTAWQGYFNDQVIQKLHIDPAAGGFTPRRVQAESWKELHAGKSIVVTSGTGSGKTECFLYPILNDLYQNKVNNGVDPVQALFLYPLNALMEDQKERLGSCCNELGLKFAAYNSSLKERAAVVGSKFPTAEVMTRERVRKYDGQNASCPQILLTNPSMLEFMLVRDKDGQIFDRSQGKLKWIVIDEAHTYTGSAAVELAYLLKRVMQAFGVTRDSVQFICTSATIGDPSNPSELIDFIEAIIGKPTPSSPNQLVNISGDRMPASIAPADIQRYLDAAGVTRTHGDAVYRLRSLVNRHPLPLSRVWEILTGSAFLPCDTEDALELIDQLCDIQIGKEYLLMVRGNFFMRNIEGLYACVNSHSLSRQEGLGDFEYLTTYKGNGNCPHCGAPLLEVVQCPDCKEFLLACEENNNGSIRSTFNERWGDDEASRQDEGGDDDDLTDGGAVVADDWQRSYLAFYGNGRTYHKPRPDYFAVPNAFKWENPMLAFDDTASTKPWMELQNGQKLYCPTCAKGSGQDGRWFRRFHTSSNWLNDVLAPSLLKETAPAKMEWGKYIAFTDSRQGTAIYAKRFNIDSERSYARARLAAELSGSPAKIYSLAEISGFMFNKQMFEHIDYETQKRSGARGNDEAGYKAALLRGLIGRRPIHVANMESLGLISIVYPSIENNNILPNICNANGISQQEWNNYLKICLDYFVRMGNHLQASCDEEEQYLRDSDRSTPFPAAQWPSVKQNQLGAVSLNQNRLVLLLCAGLGIYDATNLQLKIRAVNGMLQEALSFLTQNVLSQVDDYNDPYYVQYDGYYYLDMSVGSTACKVKLAHQTWLCPVTNYLLDAIFMGYSPAIKGCLCEENISRFHVTDKDKVQSPILGTATFDADVAEFKRIGIWNDRHKYAFGRTSTGYLTAEHSGQQDRAILSHYTEEFKARPHRLNLLQCSTTMEMGVDIGDIDLVLMTNVPPSSANYQQRAGRAGRSGQSRATAFSLCPVTAIGSQAFRNPSLALTNINPAVKPVESDIIVQRHANSFFVRQFLLEQGMNNSQHDNVSEWLDETNGCWRQFIDKLKDQERTPTWQTAYNQIFRGGNMASAIGASKTKIQEIQTEYANVLRDLNTAFAGARQNPARQNALSVQATALEEQDYKGYLAEHGFLPNANMPTGVVEFKHIDSSTVNTLQRIMTNLRREFGKYVAATTDIQRNNYANRIANLKEEIEEISRKTISTREIKIALSEYAPGQTVVIDERNYVSAGIECRNTYDQRHPYNYLYKCGNCGRYEYTTNSTLTQCPNCRSNFQSLLLPRHAPQYTIAFEPVRFRSDINEGYTRTERTEKASYNIQTILTNVVWGKAVSGPMCDIIGNDDAGGEIVFINSGKGRGFSLCLDCGKMVEATTQNRDSRNWPHNKITEKDNQQTCPVNKVENNVVLSGRFPTSFVALKIYADSAHTQPVGNNADGWELLFSLGTLLCRALAKELGVSRDDIDFGIREEQNFASLFIYDTSKGGCGYSTQMLDTYVRNNVFAEAKRMLYGFGCSCEKHITGACVDCLVDRYSQRQEHNLSKFKVMDWFAAQHMTTTSSTSGAPAVPMPLNLLVTKLISKTGTKSITFCVDASEMNLSEWAHKDGAYGCLLEDAANRRINMKLLVANVPSINRGNTRDELIPFIDLPSKFQNWGIKVEAIESLSVQSGEHTAIIVDGRHYFTDQDDVLPFSEGWGMNCASLYEDKNVPQFVPSQFPTWSDIKDDQDEFTRDARVNEEIRTTVGNYFHEIVEKRLLQPADADVLKTILDGQDVDISFSDSYVNSALASLLLVHFIKSFKDRFGFNICNVDLQFDGPKRNCHNDYFDDRSFITFNFPDADDADDYTSELFEKELDVIPNFSQTIPDHCRWIRLVPRNGDKIVEFRPDYGIAGGWMSSSVYEDLDLLDEDTPIKSKMRSMVYYLLVKKK